MEDKNKKLTGKIEDNTSDRILEIIGKSFCYGILFIVFLYLTNFYFPKFIEFLGKTGPISDTIGGIFGPIFSFGSILFVYKTVIEQVKANREIYKQNQMLADQFEKAKISDAMDRIYQEIKYNIDNFSYEEVQKKSKSYQELKDNPYSDEEYISVKYLGLKGVQHVVEKIISNNGSVNNYIKDDIYNIIVLSEKLTNLINKNKEFEYSNIIKELLRNLLLRAIYRDIMVRFGVNENNWFDKLFLQENNITKGFLKLHIIKLIEIYKQLGYSSHLN